MGINHEKFGTCARVRLVIIFVVFVALGSLAAPSRRSRDAAQTQDAAAATPVSSEGDTPLSRGSSQQQQSRRRFILRHSGGASTNSSASPSVSEEPPGTRPPRKRHLQPPASTTTPNLNPHFQPVQAGVPKDDLLPFLEFGQKLSAATTGVNTVAEQDVSSTASPTARFSRLIINIERPTSPNSISDADISSSSTPPASTRETITILTSSSVSPTVHPTPAIRLITIRSHSTPSSISQSDDAFNDIMANNHRRRRKKLVARRLQLNATEVITEHAMNDTVMSAAIVRRKSLLQPQRNISAPQSVLRRPLTRVTAVPNARYTSAVNITDSVPLESISDEANDDKSPVLRGNITAVPPRPFERPKSTNLTTHTSSIDHNRVNISTTTTNKPSTVAPTLLTNFRNITATEVKNDDEASSYTVEITTQKPQYNNRTTSISTISSGGIINNDNNRNRTDATKQSNTRVNQSNNNELPTLVNITTTSIKPNTISRIEISTSTSQSSSTTAVPSTTSTSRYHNGKEQVVIVPLTSSRNNSGVVSRNLTLPSYTRYAYHPETSTRRTWRPNSTMKPGDRHSTTPSSEQSSTEVPSTQRSTTIVVTTESTTLSPPSTPAPSTTRSPAVKSNPVLTDSRIPSSETTFGETQPSTEFTARPNLGSTRKEANEEDSPGISVATYALVSLAFVTAIGLASYGARHFASRHRRMLDDSDLSSSESSSVAGNTLKRGPLPPLPVEEGGLPRITQGWPDKNVTSGEGMSTANPGQHPEWHFPRHKLRLQTVLGQGNFGQVWKAEAEDIYGLPGTRLVAVKSTKACAGERERADLLRELAIMQQLGAHPNVVTLLGCCTEQEPHLLIMEYVMYGKLLTFLRDHRTRRDFLQFNSSDDDGGEQALTSRDLTHFAYCVAKGMDYLVSRGIIHRDLAARNVLVDHNKQCKIADFGMSRHARDSSGQVYEPKQKGALPIRWMAPESLVRSVFTHRSDVWSFGILMWEIVTLGSTPYPTMGAREVMRRVREGYRLERPPHCRPELFHVISSCWMVDPMRRPDFNELRVELRRLRDEGAAWPGGGHVDLQSALPPPSPLPNTSPSTTGSVPADLGGM